MPNPSLHRIKYFHHSETKKEARCLCFLLFMVGSYTFLGESFWGVGPFFKKAPQNPRPRVPTLALDGGYLQKVHKKSEKKS